MMRALLVLAAVASASIARPSVRLFAQAPFQHVSGVVRDSSGTPLGGAEILFGTRHATTNRLGVFHIDSVKPGHYAVTVRLIGYLAARSKVPVIAAEPSQLEYFLIPAPYLLPTVVVKGNRAGIFGTVGDTGYRAAVGARVDLLGNQGGTALTDSMGRFAFPDVAKGVHMVRVTKPGYTERRVWVDLDRGDGRELAVLLAPSRKGEPGRMENAALSDLDRRLVWTSRRNMLTRDDLARYGSMALCDVPRVTGITGFEPTVIINGIVVMFAWSLCGWRTDEIDLIEFGSEMCKDASRTVVDLAGTACSGSTRTGAGNLGRRPGGERGGAYIIIWEKK